jgi:microcompartment protein CcmL/EutN
MAASDAMNKAADVEPMGEIISGGGYTTTMVGGEVGDVRAAVAAGEEAAKKFGEFVSSNTIPWIHETVFERLVKGKELSSDVPEGSALGMVECMGYSAMTQAADAGCKAAQVELVGYFMPGGGHHAAIFRGDVAAVNAAVESGVNEASRVNAVIFQHLIPRPHPLLDSLFSLGRDSKGRRQKKRGKKADFHDDAYGYIEVKGFIPIVEAADAGLKAAPVIARGWQKVGAGLMSCIFGGETGAVKTAVEEAAARASIILKDVSSLVITGPHPSVGQIIPQPKKKK